ncbi:hypothetical protein [Arthrobacter sp. ISL-28]|uniref:hypothetical protein n=1 Tax=Arthrobacter sp. ISL-28 TaxID=2819108 RepID=UPI001BE6F7A8|nr:hypothetical protein [Arthrobacter sp. ISL-28]MBT2521108.1 hypothetical protein [Arthrobacter sp. ISL-28]
MEYVAVLLPSLVVGLLFWFAMKSIFNADRAERQAEARAQAEADANARAQAEASGDARAQAETPKKTPPGTRPDSQPDGRQVFPPADPSGPPAESDK